jgi:putative redox protein
MSTITADLTEGYVVAITNGRHHWRGDEPVSAGGTDDGPTPYELLLGAVAACTCITLSMYAQRKEIHVTSISARYTYDKLHADDCGFCEEDARGFMDTVTSEIFVEGEFSDEARAKLADIATRCPVHRTLERGITFADRVVIG